METSKHEGDLNDMWASPSANILPSQKKCGESLLKNVIFYNCNHPSKLNMTDQYSDMTQTKIVSMNLLKDNILLQT